MAGEITQLLARWRAGDPDALNQLTVLLYQELRQLATWQLFQRGPFPSLQPTSLVHEVWIKLYDAGLVEGTDREHFLCLAATVMRNFLIDHARQRLAEKHGGGAICVSESVAEKVGRTPNLDVLALHEALNRLKEIMPRHACIVELKFFAGLTIKEMSTVLGVPHATIERNWNFAQSWLHRELSHQS
jgi:RNA polymerase sigma factor (TIGR02999 family)